MKTISTLLIDDEDSSLDTLEWLLQNYGEGVEIIGKYNSPEAGLEAIKKHQPDLVFLDIEMPKMNGFDLLEKLGNVDFSIVFTTAYDQFAVRAFKYSALNYLLKPVDPDDLVATLKRVRQKLQSQTGEQLELLFKQLHKKEQGLGKIALSTSDGLVFVNTSDITYCKADSNYTLVVMQNSQRITVAKTLKEIDEILAGDTFFRVHNSYLINLNHIVKFIRGEGGFIQMPDGTEIPIARNRKDEFFQHFPKF